MLWLVVADLVPEAARTARLPAVAAVVAVSGLAMLGFQLLLL
jgi:hypothetical protein